MKILIAFVIALTIASCKKNDPQVVKELTSLTKAPTEQGKDIEILYSDSAVLKVKLVTPKLDKFSNGENPYVEFPQGLKVSFFDDQLKVQSKLTADYAIKYDKSETMEAKKNVEVINEKGEKLNTEHLIWDEKNAQLYSNEFVKITTGDEVIYGEGFEANQDFSRYKIKKIKGTFNLKDKQ